jgi:undecaprenyl-diphosphatase
VSLWQGILLGLVQGLTEFFPVSSSGHLAVVEALIGVRTPGLFVEVALHVATLASVLMIYGRRLAALALGVARGRREDVRYAGLLILATIPAGVVGVLFHARVEAAFHALDFVGAAFIVTGLVLWSTRRRSGQAREPTVGQALVVGAAQAVAIFPGISRSGSTVSAALWCGIAAERAAEFSFLLAIPTIGGAALLEGRHAVADAGVVGAWPLLASCVVAFVSGAWSIRFLVRLLRRGRFHAFAPYCWVVGALTLASARWLG